MPLKERDTLYSRIGDTVEMSLLLFCMVYLLSVLALSVVLRRIEVRRAA